MTIDRAIEDFVQTQLDLLELERQAEVEETQRLRASLSAGELERRGVALLRLVVVDCGYGLGGRRLLTLGPSSARDLPANRFSPGDIVTFRASKRPERAADKLPTGVVHRLRRDTISIALDRENDELPDEPVRLDRVSNDITYRRLRETLDALRGPLSGTSKRLREIAFGLREPGSTDACDWTPLDETLDESQRAALDFLLARQDFALLHGPPGTGKTTTLVELIRQAVARGERVLATAGSNVAVDNLVERLTDRGVRVVRLGHPARLLPSVLDWSLDALVERSEGARIASDLRRELDGAFRQLSRSRDHRARREHRDDVRRLRRELREIEAWTTQQIIDGAEVVLTTNTGAASRRLADRHFDRVVIDEAAQAIEASTWIPVLLGDRVVLAGDHLQLPPTIISREAERQGLGRTLFERLIERHGEAVARRLTIQYRMHETIMRWSSDALYGGELCADASVRGHLLADLPRVASGEEHPETSWPVLFVDTAGCDLEERQEVDGDSRANDGEARLIVEHIRRLVKARVAPAAIGVITPYNAQVDSLRALLRSSWPEVEVSSVDGFQGREKEAILLSLVRSNPRGEVGFLADRRRLNVAVTRARRHVVIVGDSATISSNAFLAGLVEYCEKAGEYRSAWELLHEDE